MTRVERVFFIRHLAAADVVLLSLHLPQQRGRTTEPFRDIQL